MARINDKIEYVNVDEVIYEGERYAPLGEQAEVGDLACVIEGWGDQHKGDFHVITRVWREPNRTYVCVERGGDSYGSSAAVGEKIEVFNRIGITAKLPSTCAKDTVKLTQSDGTIIEGTPDMLAELGRLLGVDIGEEEDEKQLSDKEVGSDDKNEVIYDKPARVGDTIRIVEVYPVSVNKYSIGDTFKVLGADRDGDIYKAEGTDEFILSYEFEIIGREETIYDKPARKGDTIRIVYVDPVSIVDFDIGDTFKVLEVDSDGDVYEAEGTDDMILEVEFEIVGREEDEEEGTVKSVIDVGDIVRVVNTPSAHVVGSLVEVSKSFANGNYFCIDADDSYHYREHNLELVVKKSDRCDVAQKLYPGDKVILNAGDEANKIPLLGLYNGHEYEVKYEGGEHDTPEGQYWISDGEQSGYATIDQLRKVGD